MTIVCSRCDGNHMRSECPEDDWITKGADASCAGPRLTPIHTANCHNPFCQARTSGKVFPKKGNLFPKNQNKTRTKAELHRY